MESPLHFVQTMTFLGITISEIKHFLQAKGSLAFFITFHHLKTLISIKQSW